MYESGDPSYLSYWAIAPIAASNSRAHSRVYEFGGTSVVVPSHSKISLNADRCSSFVRRASIFVIVCSSRFIPRTNSLHWARNFACSSRVMERPARPYSPASIKLRKRSWGRSRLGRLDGDVRSGREDLRRSTGGRASRRGPGPSRRPLQRGRTILRGLERVPPPWGSDRRGDAR